MEIRRATVADLEALATLRRAWVEEQVGDTVDDTGFEAAFAEWFGREHDQRATWLAFVGNRPVGMVNLLVFTRMPRPGRRRSQWGYLANFFVLAEHRNTGLGARLLEACTEYADAQDFVRIVTSPSERSRPLYLRSGFAVTGELVVRPGPAGSSSSSR